MFSVLPASTGRAAVAGSLPRRASRRPALITSASAKQPRQPWDFGRFLKTVLFFNPAADAVSRLFGGRAPQPASPAKKMASDAPLVLVDASDAALYGLWGSLDDGVMGGVSVSRLERAEGAGESGGAALLFQGVISTANSGGFASVRNRDFSPPVDCSSFSGLALKVKGDGQRYKLYLRTDAGWDAVAYGASFDTRAGEWQTIQLPWSDFKPIFRARTVTNAKPLDMGCIRSLQLMLSKFETDGVLNPSFRGDGPFCLPIEVRWTDRRLAVSL